MHEFDNENANIIIKHINTAIRNSYSRFLSQIWSQTNDLQLPVGPPLNANSIKPVELWRSRPAISTVLTRLEKV